MLRQFENTTRIGAHGFKDTIPEQESSLIYAYSSPGLGKELSIDIDLIFHLKTPEFKPSVGYIKTR